MSYTALYRKFRPDTFADVKGQEAIVTTLKNQIKANRIGHAYLFCGTRGTGKTTVAKILAKTVNCEHPVEGNPCNKCKMCLAIGEQASMNVIEIDAASNNGVDNIREIREEVEYRPTQGNYKVYIIDEVHMLSTGAFNALLKTLEEPPSYVIFILATTEAHKIPITILSRCQRYDFKRIMIDTIFERLRELMLAENTTVEERALRYIAKAADGSMRDALSLLDQCTAFYLGETLTYDKVLEVLGTLDTEAFSSLLRKVIKEDVAGCINTLEQLITQGKEMNQFVTDFTWYMRNLLLVKSSADAKDAIDTTTESYKMLEEEGQMIDDETLMRFIRIFSELSNQIRYASQKRVLVEIALIKICRPAMEQDMTSLLERIRILEKKIEEGVVAKPQAGLVDNNKGSSSVIAEVAEVLPAKAAPEDIQRVKSEWRMIVGQTDGMLKQLLQDAIPKYNGQTGEDKLYIEFTNSLAEYHVANPETKQELEDIICKRINKSVEVELFLTNNNKPEGLAEISVDDILNDKIKMDVTVETDFER